MQMQFNAAQFDPAQGITPWNDGWVKVVNVAIAPAPNAKGGGRLAFQIKALEGPDAGKMNFIGMNLWAEGQNAEQAKEIANKTLSAMVYVTIGAAQGRYAYNDTDEMLNIPYYVLCSRQSDNPSRNNFNAFRSVDGREPGDIGKALGVPIGGNAGGAPAPAAAPQGFGAPQQQPQAFAAPVQQQPAPFAPQSTQTTAAPFQAPQAAPAPAAAPWGQQPSAPAPAPAPAFQQQQPAQAPAFQQPQQAPAPSPAQQWSPPGQGPAPTAAAPGQQPAWMQR